MAPSIGIIGGTGLASMDTLEILDREVIYTPYGSPSSPIAHGRLNGKAVAFLARHGDDHTIPPHQINYRANLWALKHIGASRIVAVAAVGGITRDMPPGAATSIGISADSSHSRQPRSIRACRTGPWSPARQITV